MRSSSFLEPLWPMIGALHSVPVKGHAHHDAAEFAALAAAHGVTHRHHDSVTEAVAAIAAEDAPILLTGTLYLAGEVLDANGQAPV